ncbi:host attachment protein [Caballeronia glebae]|uniref:host attachment protein n=1 Tax=Caballeronia glebae TaxID=1777143 RepID=UPI0038B920BD
MHIRARDAAPRKRMPGENEAVTRRLGAQWRQPAWAGEQEENMTAITWVLAADGSRARIFETQGLKLDLRQVEDLRNPAPRATETAEKDREKFARTVADYLEQSRLHQRFDRLRLAVEPKFLGLLRDYLSGETLKLVYEEADSDVSNLGTRDIGRHLDRP